MTAKIWTSKRKWLGNLIPFVFYLPTLLVGVGLMYKRSEIVGTGLWIVCVAPILGWFALNRFGLYQNARMRRELERELRADGKDLSVEKVFVGFAPPSYASILDAHEDVGFLLILPDALEFVGEHRKLRVERAQVTGIEFRPNVHTLVGLGRWVSVEGRSGGKPIRLLVEPREKLTMLGNKRAGKQLRERLQRWLKTANPGAKPGVA